MRDGFLAVDVLAGLDRGNRNQRVRVIGGRDRHRVDVRALDDLAIVGERRDAPAVFLLELADTVLQHAGVNVAHGDDVRRQHAEVFATTTVHANHRDAEVLGFLGASPARRERGSPGSCGERQKITTCKSHGIAPYELKVRLWRMFEYADEASVVA